jgi:hypothetical protein
MIVEILKIVHVVFGTVGIGAGAWVVFGILEGKLFKKWAVVFLKCSLVASATGLLFPFHHFLPTHWAAMAAVYVSGAAVLAWRKYHLAGIWALLFALSTMLVFCLDILTVIAHAFEMLIPTQPKPLFLVTELMVMLLFVGFGLFTVRRYHNQSTRSAGRPQVNGCNSI